MHELTARDLRRSRAFHLIIGALWVLLALVCAFALLEQEVYPRPALGSAQYVLGSLWAAWLISMWTVFWAPRLTLAFGAILAVLLEFVPHHDGWPPVGRIALGFAVVALLWIAWRDSRAKPRGPSVQLAQGNEWLSSELQETSRANFRWGVAAAVGGLVAGLAVFGVHQSLMGDVAQFEATARPTTLPIVDIDGGYVTVEWNGWRSDFDKEPGVELAVGDPLPVLVQGDRVRPAGYGRQNPSWVLGLALCLPVVGLAAGLRYTSRLVQRHRLVHAGGPSATVRLYSLGDAGLILPVDGVSPRLRVIGLVPFGIPWARDEEFEETGRMTLVGGWAQGASVALVNRAGSLAYVGEIDFHRPYSEAVEIADSEIEGTQTWWHRSVLWFDAYKDLLYWGLLGLLVVVAFMIGFL